MRDFIVLLYFIVLRNSCCFGVKSVVLRNIVVFGVKATVLRYNVRRTSGMGFASKSEVLRRAACVTPAPCVAPGSRLRRAAILLLRLKLA